MITVTALLVFKTSVITSEIIFPMPGDRYYQYFEEWRTLIIPAIAAVIDLIFIKCLNFFYQKMALWLTKKELHRTQSEFDNSFTIKIFLFQFINYYSAFFYIAFVKGRFVGNPSAYTRVFNNHRLEEVGYWVGKWSGYLYTLKIKDLFFRILIFFILKMDQSKVLVKYLSLVKMSIRRYLTRHLT